MLTPDLQVRAYSSLRSLEARAQALEELIAALKRRCLHGGPTAIDDIVASVGDVRRQLRQLQEQERDLELVLGCGPAAVTVADRRQEAREPCGMRGTTDVVSVADLVGMLSSVKKTGTLTLQANGVLFVFEFQRGAIVHAVTNQTDPDLRLGTILVAQNLLTEEQLAHELSESSAGNRMLGHQLVLSQIVSSDDLRAALDVQVQRIFELAFELQHARFHFQDGTLSTIAERTSLSTMHLLLEAARQSDERRREGATCQAVRARSQLDSILPD